MNCGGGAASDEIDEGLGSIVLLRGALVGKGAAVVAAPAPPFAGGVKKTTPFPGETEAEGIGMVATPAPAPAPLP